MFEESDNHTQNTSKNPIDKEMIEDIEHLIETYIPPFMERYEEKLKDIVLFESDNITSKDNLKQKIIQKMGIQSLEDPLFKFIMHSVKPKIDPILPPEQASKEDAMNQVKQTVSRLVEGAISEINNQIERLLSPESEEVEKEQVSFDEMDDDELLAEVIGDNIEIFEESSEQQQELKIDDEIEEYPVIVTGVVDLPTEESQKSQISNYDIIKELLVERMLKKHSHKIEEKFPDLTDQIKAKEIFRRRLVKVVEEALAKKM